MKKLFTGMVLGMALIALYGCGEKTEEEQATDAVEEMQNQAEDTAEDTKDAANNLMND